MITRVILLSLNHVSHKWSKHIALDCRYIRELIAFGAIQPQFVSSHLHIADLFTNNLSRSLFMFFRSKLRVRVNPTLILQGNDKDSRIFKHDSCNPPPRL